MRRVRTLPSRIAWSSVAAAVLLGGTALAHSALRLPAARSARRNGVTVTDSFSSPALGGNRLHFLVHLPAGYPQGRRRYPVVYFLHGLPASPTTYQSLGWVAQALDSTGKAAILVAPQGTRQANGDPEYHDWGPGRDWETAIAVELPAYVDSHYRTIAARSGRAIAGLSAGGYGAAILGLHHPGEFAAIESWSGYFRPTDPTGETTLDVGSSTENAYANIHTLLPKIAQRLRTSKTFLAFYVGASDPTFVPDNEQLDKELSARRVPHLFKIYPGGHSAALWASEATDWLAMALGHLRPATRAD